MKYLTAIYTIWDEAAFAPELDRITNSFKPIKDEPWAITGISRGDEKHRLELIEEAVWAERHDLILDLLQLIDPSAFDDFSHFLSANEGGAQ